MELTQVTLKDLSRIEHEVYLPPFEKYLSPEFKLIAFQGIYGHGSAGKADARYMQAVCRAAHEAWYTSGTILDFSNLEYEWGDEMEQVIDCLDRSPGNCTYPLAIVVGSRSEQALRSLLQESYDDLCFRELESALIAIRNKKRAFDDCLTEWRKSRVGKA
ncbi:MAG: hypothetical protein V4488_16790 [Pseudomonadota bacterium]